MKRSKFNLIAPLATTFVLMLLVIVLTSRLFYRVSVSNIYEVGTDKISGITASLENYLDTAKSVLWVTADTVDYMAANGSNNEQIHNYIMAETQNQKSRFDENFTGLYGYIRGEYLDGLGWEPPEGYDAAERDWYKIAKEAGGELVIVPPYIDAQTGSMVISICRLLSDGTDVMALDVIINHIQDTISTTDIKGKGYGFILGRDGTVVAHRDTSLNGTDYRLQPGGEELMQKLAQKDTGYFEAETGGRKSTVFVSNIMDQWHLVIVVGNDELFSEMNTQLTVSVVVNTVVFLLIALFYFLAYINEQRTRSEAEALKISEQHKAYEAELLRLEKSASDSANKAKGEFLAQMSHEIRTPINAVLGMNEMILRESEDSNILEYAESIQNAGRTLLSLINSILDFSKIEDGKMEIIPVEYDTVSLINNLINSVSERAKAKKLAFAVNADPQLPRMMKGDDVRLTQIITNLLTNAVKYTESGTVTFSISCRERTDTDIILSVSVKDTGIGIRSEDMEKMFESFSRLDETRNRNIEGTGLGMAIVTKLLRLMDSRLSVESEYGKGSVFSFELRQGIADAEPIGENIERRMSTAERKKYGKKHFLGAKVLVTDDNDMNLKVARNLLRLFGINAEIASSGADTIRIMREKQFHIVFLDHMMPKMDGIETLAKLREEGLIPEGTTVIALTANAVIGAKEEYLQAGFDDYLSKPIELEKLEEKLTRYLPESITGRRKNGGSAAADDAAETSPESEIMEFLPEDEPEIMEFSPVGSGEAQKDDDLLIKLMKAGFSADSGLSYCGGDASFYRDVLKDYANSLAKRLGELNGAYDAMNIEEYCVYVHSLKSLSKTVGADDVSELAKKLEAAAKNRDDAYIRLHHAELEKLFTDRTEQIKEILL